MTSHISRLALGLMSCTLLVACDDAPIHPGADGSFEGSDAGPPLAACTVDSERLAEPRDCVRDDDCPCGAYCEFQRCAHDCVEDAECPADRVCGLTGRCEEPGSDRLKHRVTTASGLEADSDLLELSDASDVPLHVLRRHGAPDDLRVVAGAGVEVACEGDVFGAECTLRAVGPDSRPVQVRATGEGAYRGTEVRVIPRLGVPLRVAVRLAASLVEPVAWGAIEGGGVYTGTAQLVGAGFPGHEHVLDVRAVPVTVSLYPGAIGVDRVLVLHDATRALSDDGDLVATFSAPSDDGAFAGAMEIRPFLFAGERAPGPTQMQLVAQPSVEVEFFTADRARFDVVLGLSGISDRRPLLRYRIDVSRTGTAPAGSPPAAPSAVASLQGRVNAGTRDPVESRFDLSGLSGAPSERAAMAACRTVTEPSASLVTDGRVVSARLPDLACSAGVAGLVHPYAVRADSTAPDALADVLADCGADLAPLSGGAGGAGRCIDLPRALAVMGLLADAERASGVWTGEALFRRSLQQWLELHELLATDAVHFEALRNTILGRSEVGLASDHYGRWRQTLEPMLVRLLTPRLGSSLTELGPDTVASSAYQPPEGGVSAEAGDRSIAITLLRALAAEASLHEESLIEQQRLQIASSRAVSVADSERESIRRLLALTAIAAGWGAVAEEADPSLGSDPAFRGAFSRFETAYQSLLARVVQADEGRDELGLSAGEVPIYLRSDASSAADRAFAVSTYLAGSASEGWLATEISRAEILLGRARDAWESNQEATFQSELAAAEVDRRVHDLIMQYDTRLQALCPHDLPERASYPTFDAYADAVVAAWDELDPRDCMIRRERAECRSIPAPSVAWTAPVTLEEVEQHLCVTAQVTQLRRSGPNFDPVWGYTTRDGALTTEQARGLVVALFGAIANSDGATRSDRWDLTLQELPGEAFAIEVDGAPVGTFTGRQLLSSEVVEVYGDNQRYLDAERACRSLLTEVASAPEVGDAAMDPLCYQGDLGQAVLGLEAARARVSAARARYSERLDAHMIATRRCGLITERRSRIATEMMAYEESVRELRTASTVLGAVGQILSPIGGALGGRTQRRLLERTSRSPLPPGHGTAVRAAGALNVLGGAATAASTVLDLFVEAPRETMEMRVQAIRDEIEDADCLLTADRELVGLDSAIAEARASVAEAGRVMVSIADRQDEVLRLVRQGARAVRDERGFDAEPLRGAPWMREEISSFRQAMRFARRLAYLAVLAAEYEQQVTLPGLRGLVLSADSPDDLEEVRRQLAANLATRRIHGSAPETTVTVVSLRDDILGVRTRADGPESESRVDATERFRSLLVDPRFASYEGEEYVGQLIPFELIAPGRAPEGLGSGGFSGRNCAERLWSVAAAVVGDEGFSPAGTQTEVHLLKRNTFASSWCDAGGRDGLQHATFDPSRNLFLDSEVPSPIDVPVDALSLYSRLVLNNTATNTTREDMERSSYSQGVQAGLAGRGLLGEYALFIPAETLQYEVCDPAGVCRTEGAGGLDLSGVRDVLMRFEYTAAAR